MMAFTIFGVMVFLNLGTKFGKIDLRLSADLSFNCTFLPESLMWS